MKFFKELILFMLLIAVSCNQPIKKIGLSYGAFLRPEGIEFRIFAPSSDIVDLIIFSKPEDDFGTAYSMERLANGDWSFFLDDSGAGTIYGYRLKGPLNDDKVIVADPYSRATITQNKWRHVAKSLVVDDPFNWEGDTWMNIHPRDLIIYETHVRDMTAHISSGANSRGSYLGFIEENQIGGVKHLEALGVNAVQLLPIWDFANVEIPYKKEAAGMINDWNPYERNHWGYMPTFYTAPESYYASDGTNELGAWNGTDGRSINEFKQLVKTLHQKDIAVILDVVVNHVSNYDWHPLKYIDKSSYFKLDDNGNYISQCCGNLLDTDSEPARQYIIESLKYWMTEYHIDGFRFDQCYLLSNETSKGIIDELKGINPNVIIYGEAWNDRENEFSKIGWGSFNARFRDIFRGDLHNYDSKGFLFGTYRPGEDLEDVQAMVMGSIKGKSGVYESPDHAINFLEVHDDYCFSDYLRMSTGLNNKDDLIKNQMNHIELKEQILKKNKLGALILLTSQGVPLIHQGQEWAHSQIISDTDAPDIHIGKMDWNPYNKDNETNWVNWEEKVQNKELVEYYSGLIKVRRSNSELRHARIKDFKFQGLSENCLGFLIRDRVAVYLNGEIDKTIRADLPAGDWIILVDDMNVNSDGIGYISDSISLPPTSGMVLIRKN